MNAEPSVDPRKRSLPPTQEEIDAWAAREHARRAAWVAGPTAEEKQEWARRYRWRAMLGLEESRLGPAPEEIERWAARERQRREAWLAGPTEAEKRSWLMQARRDAMEGAAPTELEADAWAARERERRQAWLAGPSEEEKRHWSEQQSGGGGLMDELMSWGTRLDIDLPDSAPRLLREAELAGKGAVYSLSQVPARLWSYLVGAGRSFEDEFHQQPRRRRVRY